MHYPEKPTASDVSKIAKELVITVRREGSDPYDALADTGYRGNILDELFNKFNIFRFLGEHEGMDGPSRDPDIPPMDRGELHRRCGCEAPTGEAMENPPETPPEAEAAPAPPSKPKRVEASPNAAQDALKLKDLKMGVPPKKKEKEAPPKEDEEKPEEKEAKVASENVMADPMDPFAGQSTSDLKKTVEYLETKLAEDSAYYIGHINHYGTTLFHNPDSSISELGRLFPESQVTSDVYEVAGLDIPQDEGGYKIASDNAVFEKHEELSGKLSIIRENAELKAALETVIEYRNCKQETEATEEC